MLYIYGHLALFVYITNCQNILNVFRLRNLVTCHIGIYVKNMKIKLD